MNEIVDGLYVADALSAGDESNYRRHDIDVVVALAHGEPEGGYPDAVEVRDHPMVDGPQNDRDAMADAVRATVRALAAGESVLVHCSAGASRSPAVAAAALAVSREREFSTALETVGRARDIHVHEAVRRNARRVATTLG